MKLVTKRILTGCLGFTVVALGVISLLLAYKSGYLPSRSFNSDDWKLTDEVEGFPRLAMVDSLIESRGIDGKSEDEILTLLGPPTDTDYYSDWDAVYWLGPECNFFLRLDSEWLVLRFDDTGRVIEYQLVRD